VLNVSSIAEKYQNLKINFGCISSSFVPCPIIIGKTNFTNL